MVDLRRLRHVRPLEVPFRIRQTVVRALDAVQRAPSAPAGPAPRWPVGDSQETDPALAERLAGGWACHGAGVDATTSWRSNPVSGLALPAGPGSWLDVLNLGFDPRPAWELHRLQHLALWAHVDPTAPEPLDAMAAWLSQWPVGVGLPWASALEAACRLVSLVRLAQVHEHAGLRPAVHAHAWWIARHPSRGSSVGNHRVAELAALALAARALPDAPRAIGWRRQAAELPGVLDQLVLPDGGGAEQSIWYLATTLEWTLVARACGVVGLEGALLRGARFLTAVLDEGGNAPRIGDEDDGRVLAVTPDRESDYVRSVAGAACAALERAVPVGWAPDLRSRALGCGRGRDAACPGSLHAPHTGLTVLRVPGRVLAFDHGPVGGAHLAAHGHADALAIWLHLDGRAILVGRGTPTYGGDPQLRAASRSSLAHSTLVVDGASSSAPSRHPFLWTRRATTTLDSCDLAERRVSASHDGYQWMGVRHHRQVQLGPDEVVLIDTLEGRGRHHVAVLLHLAPDLRVDAAGVVSTPDGEVLRVHAPALLGLRVHRGGPEPAPGWHSPAYGQRVPAPTVSLEGVVSLPVRLQTTLVLEPLVRSEAGGAQ